MFILPEFEYWVTCFGLFLVMKLAINSEISLYAKADNVLTPDLNNLSFAILSKSILTLNSRPLIASFSSTSYTGSKFLSSVLLLEQSSIRYGFLTVAASFGLTVKNLDFSGVISSFFVIFISTLAL